ncbi:MAG: relaxase/mobilization nuclease domain-containing protein [Clostridia bacterium]|nr:relaxase/mobilization nuclease domain-containing protein [Clostridia bacterium]
MATTGLWPIKGSLKTVIDYADNPDKTTLEKYVDSDLYAALRYTENDNKTDQKIFVTGINCSKYAAYEQMMATKRRFGKLGGNVCYHGYQSFKAGEVSPELCHQIGVETARRMWGDQYEVIVTSHLNTENLHNHFVLNSLSFKTGKKYSNKISEHIRLREVSDEICREHHLSVLENAPFYSGDKAAYWPHREGKLTRRDLVKADAQRALDVSLNYPQFFMNLRRLGYEIDERRLSVKAPDWERNIRLSGVGLTREVIEASFQQHRISDTWYVFYRAHIIPEPKQKPLEAILKEMEQDLYRGRSGVEVALISVFLILAMLLQAAIENARYTPLSPTMRLEMQYVKQYVADHRFLKDNNIQTTDELKNRILQTQAEIQKQEAERQHIRNQIRRAEPGAKAALKEEAKAVTKKLNPLRGQLKNFQRILDKSDYVYTMLETERRLERQIGRNRNYER